MYRYLALSLILFLFSTAIVAQNSKAEEKFDVPIKVDSSAEYPGGIQALNHFLQSSMVYPVDARRQSIEGKTFVEFVVGSTGNIIPSSVRAIKNLHPSCDAEAIRVIKGCTTKWKPALKNGKEVSQRFVLPVVFSLKDDMNAKDPLYPVESAIKTIVIENTFQNQDREAWTLFSNPRLSIESGKVSKGDSVIVTGWAPWAYFIETKTSSGYVSWKSLKVTQELEKLSYKVSVKSTTEDSQKQILEQADEMIRATKAKAHLSMTANKKNVFVGECLTLTLAFNVNDHNKVPLQFVDLGPQLRDMKAALTPDNCWITSSAIVDVEAEATVIDDENFSTYAFYKASYCPVAAGVITIPAVNLNIARMRPSTKSIDSLLAFPSKPLTIKVNPLPSGVTTSKYIDYPLVGNFHMTDSLLATEIHAGEPVTYKVTIEGEGLTFPIEPPEVEMQNVKAQLRDIVDIDTMVQNQLQSSKTFVYQLIFEKSGVYDFSGIISFRVFNPRDEKAELLQSKGKVTVYNAVKSDVAKLVRTFGSKNNFIAIDASESMQIEDYQPNRLEAVKSGLKQFLMSRKDCGIGVILFAGDAKHFALSDPDKCYTGSFIDSINFKINRRGTAIGDAIWLAQNSYTKNTLPKKLVIIGDGDNTAGYIPPKLAATLAKKHNITIYTIGVGTRGLVPYGIDEKGKPNMIDNTFTDTDFKNISSITNGKYYWAKDEQDIHRILKIIFP